MICKPTRPEPGESFVHSHQSRGQCRYHQRTKQIVDFIWRKRTSTLHPPIQHENKCRGDVLNKKIRGDLTRHLTPLLTLLPYLVADQFCDHPSKVFMNEGPAPGAHSRLSRPSV